MTSSSDSIGVSPEGTELVLRRAMELSVVQPGGDMLFDSMAIAQIAAELHVPGDAVATAIAEHAAGADLAEAGLMDRLIGPTQVRAARRTESDSDATAKAMVRWLETAHGMNARVRSDGVVVASPRNDIMASVANSLRAVQGLGGLGKVKRIQVAAIDLEDSDGAACVVAEVGDKRRAAVIGGAVVTTGAAAVVGTAAAVAAAPVALLGLPIAAGFGLIVSRSAHRSTVNQVTEGLEEMLDGVVRGERPPNLLSRFKRRR
jgi:hypothetical protein